MILFFFSFPSRKETDLAQEGIFYLSNRLCRSCPILPSVRCIKQDWKLLWDILRATEWTGMGWTISSMDFGVRQTKAVQILVLLVVTKKLILFHKESSKINEISAERAQSECSSSDTIDDKYYLLLMN